MSVEGRWAGHYFEWSCTKCKHVICALQAPGTEDDELCARCKADREVKVIDDARQRLIEWLEKERLEWRSRCWDAERALIAANRELANLKEKAA